MIDASERDERRHAHRAHDDLDVGLFQQLRIGRERELTDDEPRVVIERIEALQQQREQRADIDNADPQQRRQQKQEGQELRPREEDVGDLVGDPALPSRLSATLAHAPSSMVTIADFGQIRRTLSPSLRLGPPAGISAESRVCPVSTLKRVTAP